MQYEMKHKLLLFVQSRKFDLFSLAEWLAGW